MLLIILPRGSRGALIGVAAIPYMADLFIVVLYKKSLKQFINWKNIAVFGLILYLAFFLTKIRNSEFHTVSEVATEFASFSLDQGTKVYNDGETDLMMSDYYKSYNLYGGTLDFLPWYYSLSAIVCNPIPRTIWPDKPVGVGRILAVTKYGSKNYTTKYLVNDVVVSFAVGVCGEGWINGGLFGVFFYSILMGAFSGFFIRIYWVMLFRKSYISIMIALLAYKCSSSFIRGDLLSGVTQSVYPLLMATMLLFIYSKFKKRKYEIFSNT